MCYDLYGNKKKILVWGFMTGSRSCLGLVRLSGRQHFQFEVSAKIGYPRRNRTDSYRTYDTECKNTHCHLNTYKYIYKLHLRKGIIELVNTAIF